VNTVMIVRFEVLMGVKISVFFWVMTPCGLVGRYQDFGEIYCLHPQGYLRRQNPGEQQRHDNDCSGLNTGIYFDQLSNF
jgi:hypothetical protein